MINVTNADHLQLSLSKKVLEILKKIHLHYPPGNPCPLCKGTCVSSSSDAYSVTVSESVSKSASYVPTESPAEVYYSSTRSGPALTFSAPTPTPTSTPTSAPT